MKVTTNDRKRTDERYKDKNLKDMSEEELDEYNKVYPQGVSGGQSMVFVPFFNELDFGLPDSEGCFSYDLLFVSIYEELWDAIEELERDKGMRLSGNFSSYVGGNFEGFSPCWGASEDDTAGYAPKTCVYARDLKVFKGHPGMMHSYKNIAAWEYLDHCPGNLKVALYWS